MAEVLLFHHAQGLTSGVREFADTLSGAGHTVHTPDLYQGKTFGTLDEGVAHARSTGFDVIAERGVAAAQDLPEDLVYAGFSLGVLPVAKLATSRPGAKGALFLSGFVPPSEFGTWPGIPAQVHGMDADPEFADSGDLAAAREFAIQTGYQAEVFVYPGSAHLFADGSLGEYDESAAGLLTERVLAFLAKV
ncbi:dienelactone hydrolase family protein [Kineosporia rhizophila]|uniref:dienelactone hydrolase family protein n=1 Tax=Kineosporia TaxID=49184 RepID=UPI000AB7194E|nr:MULTISPECIES: dienelactone hydrolase family protein [Kineosporia]MCE0534859.1 dienelactone hydrolase family protein [Kineosporia rhizophila]GLY14861.1 dienelactone hydrolase [Kineosporia sp. NBRC 101677]